MPAPNKGRYAKNPSRKTQQALGQADYEMLAEFRYLLRQFLIFSENAAAEAGLTAQQHQALLAIKGGGTGQAPFTASVLAGRLGIRHHSAVGLIDRLCAKGLIRRRAGSLDRRKVLLELTQKAENLLTQLSLAHRDELKRLTPLLRTLLGHFVPDDPESALKELYNRNSSAMDLS